MKKRFLYEKAQEPSGANLIQVGPVAFGGGNIPIIAGPCAVESSEQLFEVAEVMVSCGVSCIRAGAFKPRTSPYSFQGLGQEGLELLGQVRDRFGLAVVSEVTSIEQIRQALPYVDCLQVGSRNMQNFELLKALGCQEKPVLLKRGLAATIQEFLYAAEYILAGGNHQVILCERGIRSFDPMTRNVLDITSVPLLKELTHLPVIVDPSHSTGKHSLVGPAAKAAVAVGADGLIVEAHPRPNESVSDAEQALSLSDFQELISELKPVAQAVGRTLEDALPGREPVITVLMNNAG